MSESTVVAVALMAFVIWIATAAILDKMKAAARQREAIYNQLDRVADKLDQISLRVSAVSSKMPAKPSKSGDPDSWWGKTFDAPLDKND